MLVLSDILESRVDNSTLHTTSTPSSSILNDYVVAAVPAAASTTSRKKARVSAKGAKVIHNNIV
jgi:hypothetical protein